MFANRYTCLVDACSLAGVLRRNVLLSLAEAEFFRLRWSQNILDETEGAIRNILLKQSGDEEGSTERARKSVMNMDLAFDEAKVQNFEHLIDVLDGTLPDADDIHVLAAAIHTQAATIVTENLKDFPVDTLANYNIEPKSADDFIADTIELDQGRALTAISKMRKRFKRPELTSQALLSQMEKVGLIATADALKDFQEHL